MVPQRVPVAGEDLLLAAVAQSYRLKRKLLVDTAVIDESNATIDVGATQRVEPRQTDARLAQHDLFQARQPDRDNAADRFGYDDAAGNAASQLARFGRIGPFRRRRREFELSPKGLGAARRDVVTAVIELEIAVK